MKHVIVYTDGACRGNPGPGGWGVLLHDGTKKQLLKGAVIESTNNRMELTAAIEALKALSQPCLIDLYTDSQYVQKGMTSWLAKWKTNHWRKSDKQPVKNADLWQQLDHEVSRHQVVWHWVKGHNGHPENETVDQLANEAIDHLLKEMCRS